MSDYGELNVVAFYNDGTHRYIERYLDDKNAVLLAKFLTLTHDARDGRITRIIITDGGDDCVFEWKSGKGVTWPLGPWG